MESHEQKVTQDFLWLKENYTRFYEGIAKFHADKYSKLRDTAQKLLHVCPSDETVLSSILELEFDEKGILSDTQWFKERYHAIHYRLKTVRLKQIEGLWAKYPIFLKEKDPLSPLDCAVDFFPDRRDRRSEIEYCRHLKKFLNEKSLGQKLLNALVKLAGLGDEGSFKLINADSERYCRKGTEEGRLDVVINCEGHKKIIIEAKIDSTESVGQTLKYVDNDTHIACDCSYIFLTLEADEAESPLFQSVSWFDMAASFYDAVKFASIHCEYLPYFKIWLGSIVQELYNLNFSDDSGENAEQFECFIENKKYYGEKQ